MTKKCTKTVPDPYHIAASESNDLDGCATTEMTGLIPRGLNDSQEAASYESIFPYNPSQYVQSSPAQESTSPRVIPKK